MATPDRVIGIDPGTRLCGWGLVERRGGRLVHVDNGVVVLDEKRPLADRLAVLFDELERVAARYAPSVAAVEGVFQHRNARAALTLGHARGVALLVAARRGLVIHEYTPQQVKKAVCGSGRAAKEQVQQMVTLRLGLTEPPQADAADAVAVALCHAQHLALPVPAGAPPIPRVKGGRRRADAALRALVLAQQTACAETTASSEGATGESSRERARSRRPRRSSATPQGGGEDVSREAAASRVRSEAVVLEQAGREGR